MSNNKQSSVEWYIIERHLIEIEIRKDKISAIEYETKLNQAEQQAKAMHEEELNVAYGNGYEQGEMDLYKKMQCKGDKYAEGYSEGYKRALELVKHKIDNDLQGGNNEER